MRDAVFYQRTHRLPTVCVTDGMALGCKQYRAVQTKRNDNFWKRYYNTSMAGGFYNNTVYISAD